MPSQTSTTRPASTAQTFCNPLDLDYGFRGGGTHAYRHGADPVVVLYHDRYYLFSTWDRPGYRVSDDLIHWTYIPFDPSIGIAPGGTYTAAAVAVIGEWLYFSEFGTAKAPAALYRTNDPESGHWEKVAGPLPPYSDPCLFFDAKSRRVFMYHGLLQPIRGVELDRTTFAEIPDTRKRLMDAIVTVPRIRDGWEVCTSDYSELSKGMRGNKTFLPCREGAWMTEHNGTYYLQYASPGTTVPGYADGVLTGPSPLGPFTYQNYSPISQKESGFITSAGHGCLFQDRYGNWWRAVTMLIGVNHVFERRIGLFPAGFDTDGVPFTRTDLGDLPIIVPKGPRDSADDSFRTGWFVVSDSSAATASSSLDEAHAPTAAFDEDIRTGWSAATGDAGEWLKADLGEVKPLRAVQVNLAEQDVPTDALDDGNAYVLRGSRDDKTWFTIADRTAGATTHAYVAFEAPIEARYLRIENVRTAGGGTFAVSDLRAFGIAEGPPPSAVSAPHVERDPADRRKVTLTWKPAGAASGYLVRYGTSADKLYQHHFVRPDDGTHVTLYGLNDEPAYHFRIDAVNDSGITPGQVTMSAP